MARDRYYDSKAHERWRKAVLARAGGLCEICRRYGRLDEDALPVAATVAHHRVPVKDAPWRALDPANGQALCAKCHNKMHPEKGGKRR